jgi:hypothetical protein
VRGGPNVIAGLVPDQRERPPGTEALDMPLVAHLVGHAVDQGGGLIGDTEEIADDVEDQVGVECLATEDVEVEAFMVREGMDADVTLGDDCYTRHSPVFRFYAAITEHIRGSDFRHADTLGQRIQQVEDGGHVGKTRTIGNERINYEVLHLHLIV